jgi:hypothetical protein
MIQHGLDVFLRPGVARRLQPDSIIGIETSTIWIAACFSITAAGVSPGACSRRFSESLADSTPASNEHVCISARCLELMTVGQDAQFTFRRAKHTLGLRELHIAHPRHPPDLHQ